MSLSPCLYRAPHVKGHRLLQSEDNRLSTVNNALFSCFYCLLLASKWHNPENVVAAGDTENSLVFLAS